MNEYVMDELYARILGSYTKFEDVQMHEVIKFSGRLHRYREHECNHMLLSSDRRAVTKEQADQMLQSFEYGELWYDLTPSQQQRKS